MRETNDMTMFFYNFTIYSRYRVSIREVFFLIYFTFKRLSLTKPDSHRSSGGVGGFKNPTLLEVMSPQPFDLPQPSTPETLPNHSNTFFRLLRTSGETVHSSVVLQ